MRSRIPATAAADRTDSAGALEKGHENHASPENGIPFMSL
jgi:hypothetical protein